MTAMNTVRVRFAPSPTGHLHIGAARTAIYNWLFARHHRGKFVLRIEDTDTERSSEGMSQGIIESLKWLGIDWDIGPIFQSHRISLYQQKAEELVQKEKAYFCYCLPEEIQERKLKCEASGEYWRYDRHCLYLSDSERERFESEKRLRAIRFLVPEGDIHYHDRIHGSITVRNENIEDFVLLRRDRTPTYHLCVVVDDIDSGITHVIRGDDHISNTPKQLLLYRAFEAPLPEFAHQSLVLGPDKKKLSKRHGVTSVLEFRKEGFFPLVLVNFLVQMRGPLGEEQVYSVEDLISKFDLDKRSHGNPVFDLVKLEWLNGWFISHLEAEKLLPEVKSVLQQSGIWEERFEKEEKEWFCRVIDLLKERSRRVADFKERARPFVSDDYPIDPEAVKKHLKDKRLSSLVKKLRKDFSRLQDFKARDIEEALRKRADTEEVKAALLIHAVRVLVLGMHVSPDLFAVLELLGQDRTLMRLANFEKVINQEE